MPNLEDIMHRNRFIERVLGPACLAGALLVMGAAHADGLDIVMSSKMLRVAVVEDYPPFGSVGSDMKAVGYDIELASLLARFMDVKVELVVVNSANKIPYLLTKHADVLLNIGKNAEREKVVDFSEPYAPYYIGVFGPADIKVASLADLAGKSVATTRGSFEELIVTKSAPPGTDIHRFEDNATTISAFMSGQTQLVAMGNIVAAAILDKNPERRPEQKLLLLNSPVRAAVAKGEGRLLEKVNLAIEQAKKDGTLSAMALHWLKQPLPETF
jgi:polar amino acid transport system substrate-binding protein